MLPTKTLKRLRRLVEHELEISEPQEQEALRCDLRDIDAELSKAPFYTLCKLGTDAWRIGAEEGLLIIEQGIDCQEVGRGLSLLEMAARWPYDSHRVDALLPPAMRSEKATRQSAATMISRTRAWIADNRDVGLAELLRAVHLSDDKFGNVMATYRPSADAPTIMTSFQ